MANENLSDLIAALSLESGGTETAPEERLREILAELSRRPVPTSSLHRLWTVSEFSAQVALAYGALWVRGWFADAETRKRRAMETNLRIALEAFHRLSYLRGAMTKLGQAAGNMDRLVPREIADILDRLHFEAPPMHYSLIREVVANEFGRGPEELFASFDRDAFAAASIGQVHRARLHTGEAVVVKIQYPGIARTIDADLRNLGALMFPLRLTKGWEFVKGQFDEIHRMLHQEVDYRREAESTRQARALFRPEDEIVVPRVFDEYSSERVLTTEFIEGRHLNEFLATDPSQEVRDRFGTLLHVALYRLYYAYMNYGDPHSGNYLFLDDGRLALLDFGCVQHYNEEEKEILHLCEHLIHDDLSVIPRLLEVVCGIKPGDPEEATYREIMRESREWMMEPLRANGPFDFGDEGHLKRGFEHFSRLLQRRTVRGHPMYVYYHRSVFGSKSLLYRLRARVNVRAVYERESAGKS